MQSSCWSLSSTMPELSILAILWGPCIGMSPAQFGPRLPSWPPCFSQTYNQSLKASTT